MSARGGGAAGGDVSVADSPLASFETLTQAAIIAVMGIAIVISNILIIASFLNFKGKLKCYSFTIYVKKHCFALRFCSDVM